MCPFRMTVHIPLRPRMCEDWSVSRYRGTASLPSPCLPVMGPRSWGAGPHGCVLLSAETTRASMPLRRPSSQMRDMRPREALCDRVTQPVSRRACVCTGSPSPPSLPVTMPHRPLRGQSHSDPSLQVFSHCPNLSPAVPLSPYGHTCSWPSVPVWVFFF